MISANTRKRIEDTKFVEFLKDSIGEKLRNKMSSERDCIFSG